MTTYTWQMGKSGNRAHAFTVAVGAGRAQALCGAIVTVTPGQVWQSGQRCLVCMERVTQGRPAPSGDAASQREGSH